MCFYLSVQRFNNLNLCYKVHHVWRDQLIEHLDSLAICIREKVWDSAKTFTE